jgi:hypothetical protein
MVMRMFSPKLFLFRMLAIRPAGSALRPYGTATVGDGAG